MRVPLLGGTYLARSNIANYQRCVNLYPEKNPQDAEAQVTILHVIFWCLLLLMLAIAWLFWQSSPWELRK